MKNRIFVGVLAVLGLVVLLWPTELRNELVRVAEQVHLIEPPSVLFVGDIMLDRAVADHADAVGDEALFAGVTELFASHDAVVGNLEGTITTNASVSRIDNSILRFTFTPRFAEVLHEAGITAVSLANNHALDFGEFGFDDTLFYLNEQGIHAFGSPFNDQYKLATELVVRGEKICLVGYHELYVANPSTVISKLEEISPACGRTVVVAHWGVEYEHEPSTRQKELAHAFVDAGADVVIGAHPHVVQPVEVYEGKAIFYSLGNFIFDQGWMPEVRRGAAVGILFGTHETTFTVFPATTFKEAALADEETAAAVLADLELDSPTFSLPR